MSRKIVLFLIITSISIVGNAQQWKSSFEEAKIEAKEKNRKIILVFSGSDWCGPCIKLDKAVWQSPDFNKYAKDNYVMYRADFPKKKSNQLPDALRKQNLALAEKYNQDGNFPYVLLLDKDEKVLGVLGYLNLEGSEYLDKIKELAK
jgi:thioredoxin-related protein